MKEFVGVMFLLMMLISQPVAAQSPTAADPFDVTSYPVVATGTAIIMRPAGGNPCIFGNFVIRDVPERFSFYGLFGTPKLWIEIIPRLWFDEIEDFSVIRGENFPSQSSEVWGNNGAHLVIDGVSIYLLLNQGNFDALRKWTASGYKWQTFFSVVRYLQDNFWPKIDIWIQ